MGFLDKLMFWKHKEPDFMKDSGGFGGDLGSFDLGNPGSDPMAFKGAGDFNQMGDMNRSLHQTSFSQPSGPSGYSTFQQSPAPQMAGNHDMEVVAAKLDAIRATLDSINQRLANVERIAYAEQEEHRKQW